ncbi:hypothetical protein RNI52_10935 [Labrys neptuniae]|uniref:Uncharacterized protein n=1 Tax=Labrys neptuniae TaxID=376174 RepID=A0ABV3PH25_9HYPH|nr:hypothetical protein [Labrys neptuniae]MDT3377834.1 hypothetical protein [Labrys neptuniae]
MMIPSSYFFKTAYRRRWEQPVSPEATPAAQPNRAWYSTLATAISQWRAPRPSGRGGRKDR